MSKIWWGVGGLLLGAIAAPKIRSLLGGRLPSIG
jgi:hypothetical protein